MWNGCIDGDIDEITQVVETSCPETYALCQLGVTTPHEGTNRPFDGRSEVVVSDLCATGGATRLGA